MRILLAEWRKRKRPVFHIQHVNKENDQSMFYEGAETVNFKEELQPLPVKWLFKNLLIAHSLGQI